MDTEVQLQEEILPSPQSKPLSFSKLLIILLVVGIMMIAGVYIGFIMNRNQSAIVSTNTPTTRPTTLPTAAPTLRPTDPVVNGKRLYGTKGFGMTFEYPIEWKISEELINIALSVDKTQSQLQVGGLYISKNQHPDGPGDSSSILYKEKIIVDNFPAELVIKDYCWNEESLGISEKCNKVYGHIDVTMNKNTDYWAFNGPDVATKGDIHKALQSIKEFLASVKFTE